MWQSARQIIPVWYDYFYSKCEQESGTNQLDKVTESLLASEIIALRGAALNFKLILWYKRFFD